MTEPNHAKATSEKVKDEDALMGFAKFWPEALKRAQEVGLTRAGFDIRTATELARNVYVAAFYDGAAYGVETFRNALLARKSGIEV